MPAQDTLPRDHQAAEHRPHGGLRDSTIFISSATAASSCWSLPLLTTRYSFITLMSGSVCWFSRYLPVVDVLHADAGHAPADVPSCSDSQPANVHVPGTGMPTSLPSFSALYVYA